MSYPDEILDMGVEIFYTHELILNTDELGVAHGQNWGISWEA